jgi:hypothetical protein
MPNGKSATEEPATLRLPLAEAMALLSVPANYTRDDVMRAFRRAAKKAHPDAGGTAEMFQMLVKARDRLLAALGSKAPPPEMPDFAPIGARVIYRRGGRSTGPRRLGHGTRYLP